MIPLDITLRDIANTEAIAQRIKEKTAKLNLFYDNIEYCKVVVDTPQKHKHKGKLFSTHIEIGVPGKKLFANHKASEDLYVNIRDSFAALQRQLESYARKQRGETKTHQTELQGRVDRIFVDYGFIVDNEGQEYYFSSTNVHNGNFEKLQVGTAVNFLESTDGDSLQAMHVSIV